MKIKYPSKFITSDGTLDKRMTKQIAQFRLSAGGRKTTPKLGSIKRPYKSLRALKDGKRRKRTYYAYYLNRKVQLTKYKYPTKAEIEANKGKIGNHKGTKHGKGKTTPKKYCAKKLSKPCKKGKSRIGPVTKKCAPARRCVSVMTKAQRKTRRNKTGRIKKKFAKLGRGSLG